MTKYKYIEAKPYGIADPSYIEVYDAIQTGEIAAEMGDILKSADGEHLMTNGFDLAETVPAGELFRFEVDKRNNSTGNDFTEVFVWSDHEPAESLKHIEILAVRKTPAVKPEADEPPTPSEADPATVDDDASETREEKIRRFAREACRNGRAADKGRDDRKAGRDCAAPGEYNDTLTAYYEAGYYEADEPEFATTD